LVRLITSNMTGILKLIEIKINQFHLLIIDF